MEIKANKDNDRKFMTSISDEMDMVMSAYEMERIARARYLYKDDFSLWLHDYCKNEKGMSDEETRKVLEKEGVRCIDMHAPLEYFTEQRSHIRRKEKKQK